MLLNLHLQSLVISILSILVDLLYLFEVCLSALLAQFILLSLKLIFLLLSQLGGYKNILHVALVNISLFFFSFALVLLVPLLVNVKRVPVQIILWDCLLYINDMVRRYSCVLVNHNWVHIVHNQVRTAALSIANLLLTINR